MMASLGKLRSSVRTATSEFAVMNQEIDKLGETGGSAREGILVDATGGRKRNAGRLLGGNTGIGVALAKTSGQSNVDKFGRQIAGIKQPEVDPNSARGIADTLALFLVLEKKTGQPIPEGLIEYAKSVFVEQRGAVSLKPITAYDLALKIVEDAGRGRVSSRSIKGKRAQGPLVSPLDRRRREKLGGPKDQVAIEVDLGEQDLIPGLGPTRTKAIVFLPFGVARNLVKGSRQENELDRIIDSQMRDLSRETGLTVQQLRALLDPNDPRFQAPGTVRTPFGDFGGSAGAAGGTTVVPGQGPEFGGRLPAFGTTRQPFGFQEITGRDLLFRRLREIESLLRTPLSTRTRVELQEEAQDIRIQLGIVVPSDSPVPENREPAWWSLIDNAMGMIEKYGLIQPAKRDGLTNRSGSLKGLNGAIESLSEAVSYLKSSSRPGGGSGGSFKTPESSGAQSTLSARGGAGGSSSGGSFSSPSPTKTSSSSGG